MKRSDRTDFTIMQRYLASSMMGPEKFEALALYTPVGWNRFTAGARQALTRRVKEDGAGLVLMMPFPGDKEQPWPEDLKELSALINSDTDWWDPKWADVKPAKTGRIEGQKWTKTRVHPITEGVPLEMLPFDKMEVQKYELAPGAETIIQLQDGTPVMAVKKLGKGRVVTFATRARSLTPDVNIRQDKTPPYRFWDPSFRFWEAWYSLENRALLWAAGREFKREGQAVDLKVDAENAEPACVARQWKNASGQVTDWELVFTPAPVSSVEIAAPEAVRPGEKIPISFEQPASAIGAKWAVILGEKAGFHCARLKKRMLRRTKVRAFRV